jgi:hypothetical protein
MNPSDKNRGDQMGQCSSHTPSTVMTHEIRDEPERLECVDHVQHYALLPCDRDR